MNEQTRVLIGQTQGEITEKKSRFIANVFEIHSEPEALAILESIRKKYYDARHNCYAYVLGERNEIQRFSDDKEPQGMAGKPILEVISKQGYHNTLSVVTRYFGGILLGTGGLLRAYTEAAQEGLKQAEISGHSSGVFCAFPVRIGCSYSFSGKIQYLLNQLEIPVVDTIYDADVTFHVTIPEALKDSVITKITEATNASANLELSEPTAYIIKEGCPVPYCF